MCIFFSLYFFLITCFFCCVHIQMSSLNFFCSLDETSNNNSRTQLLYWPFAASLMICTLHLLRLPCVADADILFSAVVSSFFLVYSQRLQIGCLSYFHTWCGLSANLECRSEMCCTRLTENTVTQKLLKNRHLLTITQLCWAISLQLRHVSTPHHHTTTILWPFFWDQPGEPVPEENFWTS